MSQWLHGMHDAGGESLFGDKPGWIVHTIAVRVEKQGNFLQWQNQGISSLVRLNYDHDGQHGTIPPYGQYGQFAADCANYVSSSPGCNIVIIGNEPNHKQEWPHGVKITPEQYADCFNQCYQAIKARSPHVLVLVAGMACWNDQAGIEWLDYFRRMCNPITACDGFAIHGYTHGSDPNLVYSLETVNGWRWHFPVVYQTMQNIPARFATLDCYITESNQGDNAWLDNNNGWVKAAFESVDGYNGTATTQKIRALCLYRWKTDDKYSIVDKQGVQADFRDVVARGYQSPTGTVPNPGPTPEPTPPNPQPEPTPPSPSPGLVWDKRLDARGCTLTKASVPAGDYVWRCVEGLWFNEEEAQGRVNTFVTLLDENNQLVVGVPITWYWSSGFDTKPSETKNDPWLGHPYSKDYPMYNVAPSYGVKIADGTPSDDVWGTGLGDLANPDYKIHAAYSFTFKRIRSGTAPTPEPPQPEETTAYYVIAEAGATMRQRPNLNAAMVAIIPYGEKVMADNASAEPDGYTWHHCFYAQVQGWIRGDLLSENKPVPIPPPVSGDLVHPLPGSVITQNFYENPEGYAIYDMPGHDGTDFGAKPAGTPILAMADGVVMRSTFEEGGYGNFVEVAHDDLGATSVYAHASKLLVAVGEIVAAGHTIALLGSTGNSTGVHLHLSVRLINPDGSYKAGTPMPKGRIDPRSWAIIHGLKL